MARQRLKVQTSNTLTPAHLDELNKILQSCAETDTYCDKCIGCGVDLAPEKRENLEQARFASRVKTAFFPNAT